MCGLFFYVHEQDHYLEAESIAHNTLRGPACQTQAQRLSGSKRHSSKSLQKRSTGDEVLPAALI